MSTMPHRKYTLEEYIELDKNSEGRWEYFAGEVVDMAGGSLEHNQIVSNMIRVLGNQLADRGCRVLSSDMRLQEIRRGQSSRLLPVRRYRISSNERKRASSRPPYRVGLRIGTRSCR